MVADGMAYTLGALIVLSLWTVATTFVVVSMGISKLTESSGRSESSYLDSLTPERRAFIEELGPSMADP